MLNWLHQPIAGARVEIAVNGVTWESTANPAITDSHGWYQFVLQPGQRVRIQSLQVGGVTKGLTPMNLEVPVTLGCVQQLDLQETPWKGL